MPEQLVQRARDILFGGDWTPPPARPASTVVLLRDADGIEVALLQRAKTLAFASRMYVFPGGALDAGDDDLGDPWLVAAIRETYEECGVLLTVPEPPADCWQRHEEPFGQVLAEWNLKCDFQALHPFAHWVTPEVESRRFDTRFYAAALPAGQDLAGFTSEHQNVGWFAPHQALDLPMLPPTRAVLEELATFETVAAALAKHRDPIPLMPHPVARGEDIDWVLVDARTGEAL